MGTVHLICNAHLDPVWQWRWEEGVSEALATFRTAVDLLKEHPGLIFCHNESYLYEWVERLEPALFDDIRRLVEAGRWAVAGGWFIQPDVNLPGAESLIRSIAEGRRYFRERFGAAPRVAYNFDSFGHSGGLPQILRRAGYEMYIHMRPQARELDLPADLYRWRGVDGTLIPAYRIAVGLYHTERDNIEARLRTGVELALRLGRDVPVFWGLGDHGGGATRRDLSVIDAFIAAERRVRIVHSTPDRFLDAVRDAAERAPVFEGDLQRCFTGCYTSLARVKRRAVAGLGGLVQAEAAASVASWLRGAEYPSDDLSQAWKLHNFNDFHDVLTGTCIEPAERDALDDYGRSAALARMVSLRAVASLNRGSSSSPALPLTVFNANPALRRVPVEVELMADYRPFWKGTWRLRLFRADGREAVCQEEQPEALLPFNRWRRRVVFVDDLPGVGVKRYELRAVAASKERKGSDRRRIANDAALAHRLDRRTGLIVSLRPARGKEGGELLSGPLFEPLVVEDAADSWGTGFGRYRTVRGRFRPLGRPLVVEQGPVRTIVRSVQAFRSSRLIMDVVSYPSWPVLEFRFRLVWNEERRRLKLRVPTRLDPPGALCEVPGGAIVRPADGEEHVHGRWLVLEGPSRSRGTVPSGDSPLAIGIASSGQHGFDLLGGELRLSVLRSSAYCHERGFDLGAKASSWKFADLGVHEFRLLVTVGLPTKVKAMMAGLADHLAAPPAAFAHLPYDQSLAPPVEELISLEPASVRLLACKRSWDGQALVVRVQETVGSPVEARLEVAPSGPSSRASLDPAPGPGTTSSHPADIRFRLAPFEIKTLRIGPDGCVAEADLITEEPLVP